MMKAALRAYTESLVKLCLGDIGPAKKAALLFYALLRRFVSPLGKGGIL
jgi:hypothetical protein